VNGIRALRSQGVRFLATSQNIDTDQSNPVSNLIMHILAAVAEFEREMIRERVRAGLKNARAKGVRLGRKPVIVDRARVLELHKPGHSLRFIARKTGVSATTVRRILRSSKPHANRCNKNPPKPRRQVIDSKPPRR
jgi:putative DNA-invertase from lambdoid prophage Rac